MSETPAAMSSSTQPQFGGSATYSTGVQQPEETPPGPPVADHEARHVLKATLVPLQVDTPPTDGGRALLKLGYIRQLGLQPGDVESVRGFTAAQQPRESAVPWDLLAKFESAPILALQPAPTTLSNVSAAGLRAFGAALAQWRQGNLAQNSPRGASETLWTSASALMVEPGVNRALLQRAVLANAGFDANSGTHATAVGMLNLERIEMAPAGIERGGLLSTIPLAPGE